LRKKVANPGIFFPLADYTIVFAPVEQL